ncbi:hypothetical protein KJ951_02685, partial [Patescibacteria group bacterium]|nr:hypothetical protein [Patescibacteria group bacterium]MBU1703287.1 hypothetical protein [Patescibacteria group bacterium]MBU1954363.1 hypothetical protein [Patescibacteria group bacterium]
MRIKKEQYREFESLRFLWFVLPSEQDTMPAAVAETPEATSKDKQRAAEDMSGTIKSSRDLALSRIKKLREDYKKDAKLQAAATKLADQLEAHATQNFGRLSQKYNEERTKRGEPFETSQDEEIVKIREKIEGDAQKLLDNINQRLDKARGYIVHQTGQDEMEAARERAKGEGPEAKKAQETIRIWKEHLVLNYLNKAEATRGMDENMAKMLARFIVEDGQIQLEYADMDTYGGSLDAYFTAVDQFNERIGKQLEGKLPQVVRMFLVEAPNPAATPEEINHIKGLILKNFSDHYGTEAGTGSYVEKVATALARKYDIRFKGDKVSYATDLTTMITYPGEPTREAMSFEQAVLLELNPKTSSSDITDSDELGDYTEKIDDDENIKGITILRDEISEGLTSYAEGGKITSWEDWKGHSAVTKLMEINAPIRKAGTEYKNQLNQKEAAQRTKEAREKYETGFTQVLIDAGITRERLTDFTTTKEPNLKNLTKSAQAVFTRTDNGETLTITVDYNKPGDAKITMEMKSGIFSQTVEYTKPADFKAVNLKTITKETKDRIDGNTKKYNEALKAYKEISNIADLSTIFEDTPTSEMLMDPNYKVPEVKLAMNNQTVGRVVFADGENSTARDSATIYIGDKAEKSVKLSQLKATLTPLIPKMKEVAERADKNKTEITSQLKTDMPRLVPGTGLDKKDISPEGDFSKPNELIRVATLNKKDAKATITADLYIKVGTPAKGKEAPTPRQYVLKEADRDDMSFASIGKVREYIDQERARLAEIPQEPKPVELTSGRESAKANLTKIVMKLWGDKMTGIKPEDPEFSNALNTFLNGLTPKRAKELEKSDATLSDPERATLQNVFKEAYYGNLEAVDENEAELIVDIPVIIESKNAGTFEHVFGANLARIISMGAQFQKGSNDKVEVQENKRFVEATPEGLKKYVPANLQQDYGKILEGKAVTGFNEKATNELRARQAFDQIGKALSNPKGIEAFKKMGIGELIASLAQLWKMFQTAFKTGDFKSLEDGLKDFQEGRNPIERIESAKKAYE